MIINEFFPNPAGKDAAGEWIEFFNNGNAPVNLRGWSVKDASGKIFKFTKETPVAPGGYFKLDYSQSKISINNSGETIYLYDVSGNLNDKAQYSGSAPEGKSLARGGDVFVFTDSPTPGAANIFNKEEGASALKNSIPETAIDYSNSIVLNPGQGINFSVLLIWFFAPAILSLLFLIIFKNITPNIADKF